MENKDLEVLKLYRIEPKKLKEVNLLKVHLEDLIKEDERRLEETAAIYAFFKVQSLQKEGVIPAWEGLRVVAELDDEAGV